MARQLGKGVVITLPLILSIILLLLLGSEQPADKARAREVSPPTATAPEKTASYTIQGDSLTVMSRQQLREELPGWRNRSFSAAVGRQYWTGLDILPQQQLGRVVVFALGTNSWQSSVEQWQIEIDRLIKRLGPNRCLVMATIYDQEPIDSFNQALYHFAERYGPKHFQLAAWSEAVESGRVQLADGVHPLSEKDIKGRASLVAAAMRQCLSS